MSLPYIIPHDPESLRLARMTFIGPTRTGILKLSPAHQIQRLNSTILLEDAIFLVWDLSPHARAKQVEMPLLCFRHGPPFWGLCHLL